MSLGFVKNDILKTNATVSSHLTTQTLVATSIASTTLTTSDATIDRLNTTNENVQVSISKLNTVPITVSINNPSMSITMNTSTFIPELNVTQIQANCEISDPSALPKNATILVGQVDPAFAPPIDRFLTVFPNFTVFVSLWLKTTGEIYAMRTSDTVPGAIILPLQFTYIL
jgi:hypothetical protein